MAAVHYRDRSRWCAGQYSMTAPTMVGIHMLSAVLFTAAERDGQRLVVGAVVVGVHGADDATAYLAQLPGLGLGQRVEDQAADLLDVAGRGLGHLRLALAGQDRQGVAAVGRVGGAAHPAALLQPGDDLGQSRRLRRPRRAPGRSAPPEG